MWGLVCGMDVGRRRSFWRPEVRCWGWRRQRELDDLRRWSCWLQLGCSAKEMRDGFLLACEYGHDAVVEYLAGRGVDLKAATKDGQTGLHMAALGGQAETAAMLLRLGLSTEVKNGYGGAALGQARWSAEMSGEPERYAGVIAVLEVFSCMTSFTHCLQTSLTLLFFYRGVRDCVAECGSARAAGSICGGRESWGAQRFCALR